MLRLHQGKLEEAWEDLLTCHRLARLAGQGPTLIDVLIASSTDEAACTGDQALLQHAQLTASQAAKMREDLNRLPAMPRMADKIDDCERFTYLNSVADCAADFSRRGPASLVGSADVSKLVSELGLSELDMSDLEELDDTLKSLKRYAADTAIDWDLIFREGNSWFDRIADAYRKPTRAEQREAMSKVEDDFRKLEKIAADAQSLDELMLVNPRKALSERYSQVLLTLMLSPNRLHSVRGSLEHADSSWTSSASPWPPIAPTTARTRQNSPTSRRSTLWKCPRTSSMIPICIIGSKARVICSIASALTARMMERKATRTAKKARAGMICLSACPRRTRVSSPPQASIQCLHAVDGAIR